MQGVIKNKIRIIWLMFLAFCVIFSLLNLSSGNRATSYAWMLLEIWVLILDVIILKTHKFPSKKYIYLSLILGVLVSLTYFDIIILTKKVSGLIPLCSSMVITFLSGLAVFRVFEIYPEKRLPFVYKENNKSIVLSILIGLFFGVMWGALNYFLMLNSNSDQSNLSINIHCFLTSLSPAILEELAMRATFYAFCIYILKGNVTTKFQVFTYWVMMIVPHVLIHTPDAFISGGIINGLITTGLYIVVFGLIFAILQKKRDILSAMIAHGTVDFIRFCFFGLPF